MFRSRDAEAVSGRDAIAVIRRLAALVDGGVPFSRGWEYLADGADLHQRTRELLGALSRCAIDGGDVPAVILTQTSPWPSRSADSWALTALCLHIALRSGAPMSACLRTVATVLTDAEDSGQDVRAALAGARSSTRVVMCLPLVGVGLAALMGFDLSGFLFGTVLGAGCLGVAAFLMIVAWWWNGRLVRASLRDTGDTGVGSELIAMAMMGGAAAKPAVRLVEESAEAFRAARIDIASSRAVILLSERAGVPARALLRSGAEDARAATRVRAKVRAATLSVRLLVPLGVCILPSFALLSVVPLVATIISSTFAEW